MDNPTCTRCNIEMRPSLFGFTCPNCGASASEQAAKEPQKEQPKNERTNKPVRK